MCKRLFVLLTILVLTCTSTVLAASDTIPTSGTTSGGTMGKTTCYGHLYWTNNTSMGSDKSKADTSSDSAGSKAAHAVIWYTGPTGQDRKSASDSQTGLKTATTGNATAPVNTHGYKATSGHAYSSPEYGGWSKGLSKEF